MSYCYQANNGTYTSENDVDQTVCGSIVLYTQHDYRTPQGDWRQGWETTTTMTTVAAAAPTRLVQWPLTSEGGLTWAMAASLSARPRRKMRALSILTGSVRPRHSTSLMVAACLARVWVISAWKTTRLVRWREASSCVIRLDRLHTSYPAPCSMRLSAWQKHAQRVFRLLLSVCILCIALSLWYYVVTMATVVLRSIKAFIISSNELSWFMISWPCLCSIWNVAAPINIWDTAVCGHLIRFKPS